MQNRLFPKCAFLVAFFLISLVAPSLANGNPDTEPAPVQAAQAKVFFCGNGQCMVSGTLVCCDPPPPPNNRAIVITKPSKDRKVTLASQEAQMGFRINTSE
jgi:hypothetical protein